MSSNIKRSQKSIEQTKRRGRRISVFLRLPTYSSFSLSLMAILISSAYTVA
jgi:hypothetical protein